MAKLPGPTVTVNVGLVLVILLSIYLIWNMFAYMRQPREKFEGVYAPAEFYREADDESFDTVYDTYEESYSNLENVDETFAPLDTEVGATHWGDGSSISTGQPIPTYNPLIIETAHASDNANALFSV